MIEDNFFFQVRQAAARHLDNRAVVILAEQLEDVGDYIIRTAAAAHRRDPLDDYEKAYNNQRNHSPMWEGDAVLLNSLYRRMQAHHKAAIVAQCLAKILEDLGEKFPSID